MRNNFTQGLLIVSAIYAVAAVFMFLFVYSPSASVQQISFALLCALSVVLPYGVLFASCQISKDKISHVISFLTSIVAMCIGAYVYFFSFRYNDGEYVYTYFIVPIIQGILAAITIIVSLWRSSKSSGSYAA